MICLVCISSLIFCLDQPHSRQVMLVHGSFFGLLICLLVMRGTPLPLFLYFFLTLLIFFSLLLHHLPSTAVFSLWPLGRNVLKIALPVAAILLPIYFFFPEIRPPAHDLAVSGMSDILEPGRIASLALSDRLAFRARFRREVPAGLSLYWRVAVLEESYGMIWRKRRNISEEHFTSRSIEAPIEYELAPEDRLGMNLPLLEHTLSVRALGKHVDSVWWQPDLRLFRSQSDLIQVTSSAHDRYVARQPPPIPDLKLQISERTQNLVDRLKLLTGEQQVATLLQMMSSFFYTLDPGTLRRDDALDDFLFEQKKGFCEHFAAAFATLLQLSGTPARVVTGYEGGIFIGSSDFLAVRDSDAHAWTEVFLDNRWRRIDPSRVALNGVKPEAERLWLTALPAAWLSYALRWLEITLREWTDNAEFVWLGLVGVLAVVIPLQIWRTQRKIRQLQPWQKQMDRFLRDCQRQGLSREANEGMKSFLQRLHAKRPDFGPEIQDLSQVYLRVVYDHYKSAEEAHMLSQKFRAIRRQMNERAES